MYHLWGKKPFFGYFFLLLGDFWGKNAKIRHFCVGFVVMHIFLLKGLSAIH